MTNFPDCKCPSLLAQVRTEAGKEIELYKPPRASHVYMKQILFCNTENNTRTVSLAICPGGKVNHPADWVYFKKSIPGNDTLECVFQFELKQGDTIRVLADTDGISASLFGEKT